MKLLLYYINHAYEIGVYIRYKIDARSLNNDDTQKIA